MALDRAKAKLKRLREVIKSSQYREDSRIGAIDGELASWGELLDKLATGRKPSTDVVLDGSLNYCFQQVAEAIELAPQNGGLDWLLQHKSFCHCLGTASALLGQRAALTTKALQALAKVRETESIRSAELVRDAATQIPEILSAGPRIADVAAEAEKHLASLAEISKSANEVATDARAAADRANSDAARADQARKDADGHIQSIALARVSAEESAGELSELLSGHSSQVDTAEAAISAAIAALESSKVELVAAHAELAKARADLNRQGLADAFRLRADALGTSRKKYEQGFALTVLIAVLITVVRAASFDPNAGWPALVVYLPAAGALVWLAWHFSRRANVISRVLEDYEYKKASALTFEGYKREVGDTDERLKTKLVRSAIDAFGANPTRLMPSSRNEHTSPIESGMDGLGRVVDKLSTMIDKVRGRAKPGDSP